MYKHGEHVVNSQNNKACTIMGSQSEKIKTKNGMIVEEIEYFICKKNFPPGLKRRKCLTGGQAQGSKSLQGKSGRAGGDGANGRDASELSKAKKILECMANRANGSRGAAGRK